MKFLGYNISTASPTVLCKLFEDNCVAMELAWAPAMKPSTMTIHVEHHHFRAYIVKSTTSILPIYSAKKPMDMVMHPYEEDTFICNRRSITGW